MAIIRPYSLKSDIMLDFNQLNEWLDMCRKFIFRFQNNDPCDSQIYLFIFISNRWIQV